MIVGFPGETEQEFETTKKFIEKVDFYETHIFKYSKREGTLAAKMPDQVPEQVKTLRSEQLIEISKRHQRTFESWYQGKKVEVLVEKRLEEKGESYWIGHTREYLKIALEGEENLQNKIVMTEIESLSQIID